MPMIYKRFTEKAAEEWRQIYKGLQLLEFLIKNGSERVIDDARSHLSLLKMLRQFHFIDQNGKDQGVNVRNRSKELVELLGDVDRIRGERKKARANRNKFGGVEGGTMAGGLSSSSRYGGFGSEDAGGYGAYSGGVYGDGGGYGGNTGGFDDTGGRRDRFEEYDEYDEGAVASPVRRKAESSFPTPAKREAKKAEPPKKREPEVDLFAFGDDDIPPETPPKEFASNGKKAILSPVDNFGTLQTADDDDFDDFQSATPSTQTSSKPSIPTLPPPLSNTSLPPSTQYAAPKPVSAYQGTNINDLVGFNSISPALSTTTASRPPSTFTSPPITAAAQLQPRRPSGYQAAQPNYFTSVSVPPPAPSTQGAKPSLSSTPSFSNNAPPKSSSSSTTDAFGSLWSTASAGAGIKKTSTPSNQGPNLASMAKDKTSASIWGASASSPSLGTGQAQVQRPTGQMQGNGGGLDDLLG
ncbi:Epsin-3, clathrin recruitment and traffic between the Golgi and endosome [Toensbergia leucococca]|nr:Epsin-3, clathrin recruitment and traffic between the Golgi and endosome [Toensbergia leucococca]